MRACFRVSVVQPPGKEGGTYGNEVLLMVRAHAAVSGSSAAVRQQLVDAVTEMAVDARDHIKQVGCRRSRGPSTEAWQSRIAARSDLVSEKSGVTALDVTALES